MSVFYHVVMMKYRDGADAAFHEKVQEYCQAIQEACAGVLSYDYATNKATRSQGYDFAILAPDKDPVGSATATVFQPLTF